MQVIILYGTMFELLVYTIHPQHIKLLFSILCGVGIFLKYVYLRKHLKTIVLNYLKQKL